MTQLQSLELEVIQTGGHKEHWVGVRSLGFEPRAPSPAAKGLSVPSLEGQSPFSMGSGDPKASPQGSARWQTAKSVSESSVLGRGRVASLGSSLIVPSQPWAPLNTTLHGGRVADHVPSWGQGV